MNVMIFGATGMVGQGVLRECLLDAQVAHVLTVGRRATGTRNPKLRELVHANLFDYTGLDAALGGFDACFFCLGVSSVGMSERDYTHLTYDLTLAAAEALARLNPQMTFVYVSGAGTDSTGEGRSMWARVKGKTENALLKLPFKAAFMFRPGLIQPLHGIRSKTRFYQTFYSILGPLLTLLRTVAPKSITTTQQVGRAMIAVARDGHPKPILDNPDINAR
ncbi:MAG: NAD-dependent epimerase/dehydratase family protein [Pararobbsia sp.]